MSNVPAYRLNTVILTSLLCGRLARKASASAAVLKVFSSGPPALIYRFTSIRSPRLKAYGCVVVVRRVANFRAGILAGVLTLVTIVLGPNWYLLGRGLSEASAMAWLYLAGFALLRARDRGGPQRRSCWG